MIDLRCRISLSSFGWVSLTLLLCMTTAEAQTREGDSSSAATDTTKASGELERKKEKVVVTASRKEQILEEVPAAVTVYDDKEILESPADNYADGLRGVPGVNIAQTSAGDISISTRTATSVIPQGQLAMMDHRSFYQDFNGYVLWGAIPVEPEDIKRIEVVRGPGSAVWGANAMHGIVHLVTKAPKEMVGTRIKLGGGELNTGHANITHAAVHGKLGYRVSAGYSRQDAFSRPTGSIPGTEGPNNPTGTPYPEYENLNTKQPRVNFRLDYDSDDRTTWSFSGGYAALEGMFLTHGGPSTLEPGTIHAFGKIDWTRGSMRATAFFNQDAFKGTFVLANAPVEGNDQTYNVDFTDTRSAGERHILTYGGNVRYNVYDNDLAREGKNRDSYGAFLQDDIYLGDPLRLVVGARWDYIDPMGNAISPRVSLLVTPWRDQQLRLSYNRAFQSPSVLQNFIDFPGVSVFEFPDFNNPGSGNTVPVAVLFRAVGNIELEAKRLDSFEVGWMGRLGSKMSISVAGFWNEFTNAFQNVTTEFYTASNPPPGWPFDPALLDGPLAGAVPSQTSYANLGKSTERGVEVGGDLRLTREWSLFGNYSWQDTPEVEDFEPVPLPNGTMRVPVNTPPKHRFNLGVGWDIPRFYVNANVTYQDKAFWADVLDPRFWGPTEAFTMVNLGTGVRFANESLVLSVNGINVFDERAQQHVWGDIINRRIMAQIAYRF